MNDIYLDHAATTPLHPEVLEVMIPYYREHFGNPSSMHTWGQSAKIALGQARDLFARGLSCSSANIVFTSGGTESDNMALFGMAASTSADKRHIITSQIEHHAVLHACNHLERMGYSVTYLPVNAYGQVAVDDVYRAIRSDTLMISLMYGNNEVGTVQPIEEVGKLARENEIVFHVDAVQALGRIAINLQELPVDLMSFSAHKINGPKGVGALYVSPNVPIQPFIVGGSQERKRRAGTENVAGIVGFAKAFQIAMQHLPQKNRLINELRSLMAVTLQEQLGHDTIVVNGHPTERLPHILNISFSGIDTETMLMSLDLAGIAAASGSACTSGSLEISHVLQAMKLPDDITRSAVRFSFGMNHTAENVIDAARKIATIAYKLRNT